MGNSPIFLALIAVACWSTSATAVGLLGGTERPFLLAACVQALGAACLLIFGRKNIGTLFKQVFSKNVVAAPGKRIHPKFSQILIFTGFLILYHYLFYSAMMSPSRLQANIANYLWPILLVGTNYFVFRNTKTSPKFEDFLVLGLGFLGCAALVGDKGIISASQSNGMGLLFGILAACCAAIYMGQSAKILRTSTWTSVQIWFVGLIIAAPISFGVAWYTGELQQGVSLRFLEVVIWLGVITVALAQVAWTASISRASNVIPNILVYVTPILSTLLQWIFFKDQITPSFAFGLLFIVFASLITTRSFNSFFSELGASIVLLYSAFVLFYKDIIAPEIPNFGWGDVPIELFGIIAGFFLSRQWQRSREEEISLTTWGALLEEVCEYFTKDGMAKHRKPIAKYINNVTRAAVDFDQSSGSDDLIRRHSYFHSQLNGLEEFIRRCSHLLDDADKREISQTMKDIRKESARWIALKSDKTSNGDLIVVALIGVGLIVIELKNAILQPGFSIPALIIPAIVSYIGFRIAEYNIRPAMNSISSIIQVQRALNVLNLPYYIGDYKLVKFNKEIRVLESWLEFYNEGELCKVHSGEKKSQLTSLLIGRNFALAFLICIPAIVAALLWFGKHNG